MNYQINSNYVKAAEGNGSKKITEKGAYIGEFIVAREVESKSGSVGIALDFKDMGGAIVRYNTLWTYNAKREPIFGLNFINSLMYIFKLRNLAPRDGYYKEYDFSQMKEVEKQGKIFPELLNRKVGVILQPEEYEAKDGSIKESMKIRGFFDADTGFTATELMTGAEEPMRVEQMLNSMPPVQKLKRKETAHSSEPAPEIPSDDIPF